MENLLDDIDRQILACLVEDARMSLKVLSGRIGLTSPSTAERLKRLEERGVIEGYGAARQSDGVGVYVAGAGAGSSFTGVAAKR